MTAPTPPTPSIEAAHIEGEPTAVGFHDIGQRIAELKSEFEAGQKMLADLDTKKRELEATMLRIGGAIQVLEELIAKENKS